MLLASESADKPNFGEVVAVGPGKKEGEGDDAKVVAPNVQAGQTVMYSKYSGTEFEVRFLPLVLNALLLCSI